LEGQQLVQRNKTNKWKAFGHNSGETLYDKQTTSEIKFNSIEDVDPILFRLSTTIGSVDCGRRLPL
jgi:hypothetical protein